MYIFRAWSAKSFSLAKTIFQIDETVDICIKEFVELSEFFDGTVVKSFIVISTVGYKFSAYVVGISEWKTFFNQIVGTVSGINKAFRGRLCHIFFNEA